MITDKYYQIIIELDDGNFLAGKPIKFDGKNPWVSGEDFPLRKPIQWQKRQLSSGKLT